MARRERERIVLYLVPLRLGRGLGEAQGRLLARILILALGEDSAHGVDGN